MVLTKGEPKVATKVDVRCKDGYAPLGYFDGGQFLDSCVPRRQ